MTRVTKDALELFAYLKHNFVVFQFWRLKKKSKQAPLAYLKIFF